MWTQPCWGTFLYLCLALFPRAGGKIIETIEVNPSDPARWEAAGSPWAAGIGVLPERAPSSTEEEENEIKSKK